MDTLWLDHVQFLFFLIWDLLAAYSAESPIPTPPAVNWRALAFCHLFSVLYMHACQWESERKWCVHMCICRISLKSRHGDIYFKPPFSAATIRRQLARFHEWHLQRTPCMHIHSINSRPICMHALYTCTYIYRCRPFTMWQDFEGGIYWDKLAETCCDILRVVGFRGVARNIVYTGMCNAHG